MPTFDIIVPVKDSNDRIIDWKVVSTIFSSTLTVKSALEWARDDYGNEADIREKK